MIYKKSWKYILIKDNYLFRIKSLKDFSNVQKGELGGYIEGYHNLSQTGNCWVYNEAKVRDYARVSENAQISDKARVYEYAQVFGNVKVHGKARVSGNAIIKEDAQVGGFAIVKGSIIVRGETYLSD